MSAKVELRTSLSFTIHAYFYIFIFFILTTTDKNLSSTFKYLKHEENYLSMAMLNKDKLWNMSVEGYKEVKSRLLSFATHKKGGSLLDIGCGPGEFTNEIGKAIGAGKLYGIDKHDSAIKKARKRGIIVKKLDLDKAGLPFRKKSFDVIVCNQVIEHLLDPDKLVKEIYRTLKDDGYALVSTPNLASLHNRFLILFGSQPTTIAPSTKVVFGNPLRGIDSRMRGPSRHITAFTYKSLTEMLKHYNFRIDKYSASGFYPFKGWFAEALAKLLPNLAVYNIVRVRKR